MLKIGRVRLGPRYAIAVTLSGRENPETLSKALRSAGAIHAVPAGRQELPLLLELRIDRFPQIEKEAVVRRVRSYRRFGLPLIATIRKKNEGGARWIPDSGRFGLFRKILPFVEAIDLELASSKPAKDLIALARRRGRRVILSHHDFRGTPSEGRLVRLIRQAKKRKADAVKIAVTPRENSDVARLLLLTERYRSENLITIAMGQIGRPSRILAPLFGSLITYSCVGRPQAPGQISLSRLTKEIIPL